MADLADRGSRLVAFIIDGLLVPIPLILIGKKVHSMGSDDDLSLIFILLFCVLGFLILQVIFLARDGQTIGKKATKIRIVKVSDGKNGGFVTNVLLRTVLISVMNAVPFAGAVFCLVDVLFIFGKDRRCVHDLIAGTRVVSAAKAA